MVSLHQGFPLALEKPQRVPPKDSTLCWAHDKHVAKRTDMVIHQGLRMGASPHAPLYDAGPAMAPFGACASSRMAGSSWQSGGGMRLLLLSAISSISSGTRRVNGDHAVTSLTLGDPAGSAWAACTNEKIPSSASPRPPRHSQAVVVAQDCASDPPRESKNPFTKQARRATDAIGPDSISPVPSHAPRSSKAAPASSPRSFRNNVQEPQKQAF